MNLARNLMLKKEVIEASDELVKETFWQDVFRSLKKDRMAITGGIVILLFVLMAIFAPWIAPHDPYEVNLDNQFQKPGLEHWLGTDMFGRDVLSRIIYGSQISLLIGLVPSMITMSIGIVLGIVAGYFGRRTDFVIMTISDMVLSFPSLLLAMVVMYTLGASLLNIFIALSIVGWAGTARVVRAQTLSLKNKEFVEAARAVGVKPYIIMLRHILPNCIPQLLVLFTLEIPGSILSEASLSFLGVGAQPPASSWGLMVSNGKEFLFNAPWVAIAPGIAILVIVLAFNFLGDGLRDALDPYLKQ
ncbi:MULTISPECIES: ABC transporter permease [Brevibacillus]|jgi:ABC-type dipeptide/oligopeptide/nickel transport system permease subunit|uniref:Peptide/nickel transport system permease protein/oligopeptide transport system permease protein n=2 Tax=Brevibacillus TaxID=55080 RepID=A0A1I3XBQ8_9BACL|nr:MULTISPECIES: ABC transporter permease [Brevibacillus]MEC2133172.1 ABC transporter permease [Brevibacillus centrosporus]MED1949881.1 ABC transporter permease [Brevibacillus centrosporus]GED31225.1 glutathione ABC transporter permease GsiD [Brevibacillus centrosporus]SFK16857.1 peptide/nickel transport system permease protein/oligopeptide transport system permease protein [Brevibacillus centrosporus]